jgi:hypothetical protein
VNDDSIDRRLRAAGARARAAAPDADATRRALGGLSVQPHRPRWPMFAAAGLVAASLVGIVAVGLLRQPSDSATPLDTIETTTPTTSPLTTMAPTTPATTVPPESTTTTAPPPLGRLEVAPGIEPECVSRAGVEPSGELFTFVSHCTMRGDEATAIVQRTPTSGPYVTLESSARSTPIDLGTATPVDGMPGLFAYTAQPDSAATCHLLVGEGTGWRELCRANIEDTLSAIATIDGTPLHVDVGPTVRAAPLTDGVLAATGCTAADFQAMLMATDVATSTATVTGLRCEADRTSVALGSSLSPWGPTDGYIALLERIDGTWTVVDSGTGGDAIEAFLPHAIPGIEIARAWRSGTAPVTVDVGDSYTGDPIMGDTFSALLQDLAKSNGAQAAIVGETDDLVAIEVGPFEDDSVSADTYFLWVDRQTDQAGTEVVAVEAAYRTSVCTRGVDPLGDVCV